VDAGGTSQKVDKEQEIKQGSDVGQDAARVATLSGAGAAIGAGVGGGVGLAVVMLTRGREVTLRRGSTIDVVFDRAVPVN
jgi:hypothetical protein